MLNPTASNIVETWIIGSYEREENPIGSVCARRYEKKLIRMYKELGHAIFNMNVG